MEHTGEYYRVVCGQFSRYEFDVHYDTTPEGFEDKLESSTFSERLGKGTCFSEVSHPVVDDHQDPRVILKRQKEIDPRRVQAQLVLLQSNSEGFKCGLIPAGPYQGALMDTCNYRVAPRMITDEDGKVIDIITFDFVQ